VAFEATETLAQYIDNETLVDDFERNFEKKERRQGKNSLKENNVA
jgi:hypothetical protein